MKSCWPNWIFDAVNIQVVKYGMQQIGEGLNPSPHQIHKKKGTMKMEKTSAILWDMNMTGFSKNREGLEVEEIGFDAIKVTGTHDRVKKFIDDTLFGIHLSFKPCVEELGHEVWLADFVGLGIIFDGYALEITNTSDTFAKEGYWIAHFYINGKWHYCALRSFATTWDESVKVFKELHEAGKNMIKDTTPPEYYNLLYMEKGV